MIGVLHQLFISMELGLYHHTDYTVTIPANTTLRFSIAPPTGFYGFLAHSVSYGDMLSNAVQCSISHLGYEFGTKNVHPGIFEMGSNPWMWVEPGKEIYVELTNLLAIPTFFQLTQWEVYFETRDKMDLAKLAFWEFVAPYTYNLAVKKGIIAPLFGTASLPTPAITAPIVLPGVKR